jgi:HPt (histidine-containing phosphotransfer) domain-containing protein
MTDFDKASHFDIEALKMLEEIMEDDFPKLIEVFIVDSDPRIAQLQKAFENNDCNELREISHSFKGASGNISALPLADLCFQLEETVRKEILDGVSELIARIGDEYKNVRSILLSL